MSPAALPAPCREKMSSVDSAWLRMDSPANLMMIVALLMFERPLETGRAPVVLPPIARCAR